MSGLWLLSYLALWVVAIGLVCLLVGVLQQFGVSQQRLRALEQAAGIDNPTAFVPPENDGPALGTRMPDIVVETANGYGTIQLSAQADASVSERPGTLLVCMQPLCEGCQFLVDPLNRLMDVGSYPGRVVVLLNADSSTQCDSFLKVFPLRMPVVCNGARALLMTLGVHNEPFSLLYDGSGVLIHKAATRTFHDLEALISPSLMVSSEKHLQRQGTAD